MYRRLYSIAAVLKLKYIWYLRRIYRLKSAIIYTEKENMSTCTNKSSFIYLIELAQKQVRSLPSSLRLSISSLYGDINSTFLTMHSIGQLSIFIAIIAHQKMKSDITKSNPTLDSVIIKPTYSTANKHCSSQSFPKLKQLTRSDDGYQKHRRGYAFSNTHVHCSNLCKRSESTNELSFQNHWEQTAHTHFAF